MHIAIAGNIGSGKTTLTKMLAKRYGWKANFEPVDNNPYLADYYKDMERWSFNLQIYFLNKRFHDVVEISRSEQTIVQDRTIFEDARIFAPNLHDIGMMSDRDFKNYTDLFDLMISLVKLPDLMIYIKSSIPTLVKHIEKRGRDFEKSIRIDYLQGLNNRYEEWRGLPHLHPVADEHEDHRAAPACRPLHPRAPVVYRADVENQRHRAQPHRVRQEVYPDFRHLQEGVFRLSGAPHRHC